MEKKNAAPSAGEQKNKKSALDKVHERREAVSREIEAKVGKKKKFAVTLVTMLYAVLIPLVIALVIFMALMSTNLVKEIYTTENTVSINVFDTSVKNIAIQIDSLALRYQTDQNLVAKIVGGNASAVNAAVENEVTSNKFYAVFYNADGTILTSVGSLPTDASLKLPSSMDEYSDYFKDEAMPLSYRCYTAIKDTTKNIGYIQIGYSLEDLALVDGIKEQVESEVTVFAGNVRLVTTIIGNDGNRVIGTTMDPKIAEQVITLGLPTSGEGKIVNEYMIYTYHPLKNQTGEVLGAIFVGNPLTEVQKRLVGIAGQGGIISLLLIAAFVTYLGIGITKKQLSTPMRKVMKLANDIEVGNLQVEHLDIITNNEAGQLADTMNKTVKALNMYINDISNMLTRMAHRDFSVNSQVEYQGDFEALQKAAELIKGHTRDFIVTLNEMTTDLNANAAHIASASQQVATGTTEQASTVEELSSSIIEINNNVERNAENARTAKELSDGVSENISVQSKQMEEMLIAMRDIEAKSGEIQKIIKTIDNIAFQTNILALNAAVEAARAGDAGKGFAVVADEVRNLASKSADAANNTTTLIQASIASVQHGSEIAQVAAESLENVVKLTGNTHSMIDNISVQSEQQAEAIRQITMAIEQISNVVQSNSAVAEETMAASQELDAKARELKNIVDKYVV